MNTELFALLRLGMIQGIGNTYACKLLQHFQNAQAIFEASPKLLSSLMGPYRIAELLHLSKEQTQVIEEELDFISKFDIQVISILDSRYPEKLRHIPDAPYLLFYQGNASLNHPRQIAIIGSRQPSEYGKEWAQYIVGALQPYGVTIVSGMAYGIDSIAHKNALLSGLSTIGVLAHGLDRIYPAVHERMAKEMISTGGLLTEYKSQTDPERQNFPMRNRIVAGMCDATLVVETDIKGGAMITAKLALGYNREVMAVPGRSIDQRSAGCNYLIKTQMGQLVTDVADILQIMNWGISDHVSHRVIQPKLFDHCNERERTIIDIMEAKEYMHIDELQLRSGIKDCQLASVLLQLEFQQIVTALPGKRYKLSHT